MTRTLRALAVLLLSAASARAQVVRVGEGVVPLTGAPALAPAFSVPAVNPGALSAFAPSLSAPALAPTFAPALAPALSPAFAAPALEPAPSALPAAAAPTTPALVPAAAPALAPLAAAADGSKRGRKSDSIRPDDDTTRILAGAKLFDGAASVATRSGSVFSYEPVAVPSVKGGAAFVRVKPAPAAPVKSVPDTQGLSGSALLDRVGKIAAKNQTTHDYHEASHYLFSTADNHTLSGVRGVADAYSGVFVPGTSPIGNDYSEQGDEVGDGYRKKQGMNVEHVFPQSLFDEKVPMRSDLHHLMATLEHPNGMRGNLPFGVVTGPTDYSNHAGAKRGGDHFEPPDFTKGRVARAMLYFYARYKNEAFMNRGRAAQFWNGQVETLLDWNRRFPPTIEERRRNDHVEAFQGNRNPFVDDPSLADKIGLDAWYSPRAGRPSVARTTGKKALKSTWVAPSGEDEAPLRRSDKPRKGGKKRASFKRANAYRGRRR